MRKQKFCKPNFPEQRHMLVVCKRTVSMGQFYREPKIYFYIHEIIKIVKNFTHKSSLIWTYDNEGREKERKDEKLAQISG